MSRSKHNFTNSYRETTVQSIDTDYVRLAIQVVCLFLILWGAVFYPLVCAWVLWRRERRLMIFVTDMGQARKSEFEDRLWIKTKKMSRVSVWGCVVLGITWFPIKLN